MRDAAPGSPPDDLDAVAAQLVAAAGLAPVRRAERLAGGKNNRVFRLDLADGRPVVLKRYHVDSRDRRDRLGAEWRFLRYVWDRGVRCVPEPLAADPSLSAGLYGFLPGRRLEPAEIDAAAIRAAADFIVAVNAGPSEPERLAPGSEACFSLADHVAMVERRVARLADIDAGAPFAEDARCFVAADLAPAWGAVRERLGKAAATVGFDPEAAVRPVISPSDFGFHNVLRGTDGRLVFLDFEYAGRDDPAKLVCDFFCQPEIPVPAAHFEAFAGRIADGLGLSPADRHRCALLLDAYRIKWVCIILNEFLPVGADRRAFADGGARALRCERQLERARHQLARISK